MCHFFSRAQFMRHVCDQNAFFWQFFWPIIASNCRRVMCHSPGAGCRGNPKMKVNLRAGACDSPGRRHGAEIMGFIRPAAGYSPTHRFEPLSVFSQMPGATQPASWPYEKRKYSSLPLPWRHRTERGEFDQDDVGIIVPAVGLRQIERLQRAV